MADGDVTVMSSAAATSLIIIRLTRTPNNGRNRVEFYHETSFAVINTKRAPSAPCLDKSDNLSRGGLTRSARVEKSCRRSSNVIAEFAIFILAVNCKRDARRDREEHRDRQNKDGGKDRQ